MSLPFISRYKNEPGKTMPYAPPNDDRPIQNKLGDRKLYQQKAEFIYYQYINGHGVIPFSTIAGFQESRLYAAGQQPITKYQDVLSIKDKKTQERKGWMNISWDNVPILPQMLSRIEGKFDDIDWNTTITGLDDQSHAEREDAKMEVWVRVQEKDYFDFADRVLGIKSDQQKPLPFQPKHIDDLEMLASTGSFKTAYEIKMKKLSLISERFSTWHEIKKELAKDAIKIGYIATRDYTDPITGKPMMEYLDPEYLIVPSLHHQGAMDYIPEGMYVKFYSIKELRTAMIAAGETVSYTDEKLKGVATTYNGVMGNPTLVTAGYNSNFTYSRYCGFKVAVAIGDFESFDTEVSEIAMREDGSKYVMPADYDAKKPSTRKGKIVRKCYPKRYRFQWVIGTDAVFDYGHQFNVPYDEYERPKSSFNIYKIADRSIVDQCKSVVDDFQLCVLKLRNEVSKAKGSGVAIEWGALSEITQGGEKLTPWEVLKIYSDTSNLVYKLKILPNGQPMVTGQLPITELKGGMGAIAQELLGLMAQHLQTLRSIIGTFEGVDGASAPLPGALVGTTKIAAQATDDALKPLLSAMRHVKRQTLKGIVKRWALLALNGGVSEYFTKNDGANIELIELDSKAYNFYFDLSCEEEYNQEQQAIIVDAAKMSLQATKAGSPGLTMSQFFKVMEYLTMGECKAAETFLAFCEERAKKEAQDLQAQNMQLNNQGAQQVEQMKQQGAMQTDQMAQKHQLTILDAQTKATDWLDEQAHQRRLKELDLTGQHKAQQIVLNNDTKETAQPQATPQDNKPSQSISFKDLPRKAKVSMLAEVGINVTEDDFVEKESDDNQLEIDKAVAIQKSKPKPNNSASSK